METLTLLYFAIKAYSTSMVLFVTDPTFLIFLMLLFIMYRRIVSSQIVIYGDAVKYTLKDLFSTSILSGMLGGLLGAVIITVAGITFFNFTGLEYIFILSLILMMVHPRYICFSYSGGILGFVVLITTHLINGGHVDKNNTLVSLIHNHLNFDVTAMVALIAVLHLIEGILVWFDGYRGALPVFTRRNGQIVGGFIMQRYWIVPILLYGFMQNPQAIGEQVATPPWWPLVGPAMTPEELKKAVFAVIAFMPAILGYSDFAVTSTPKEKAKTSSVNLLIFSLTLLLMAVLSVKIYVFKYIAVLFAPIGHDAMILYQRYKEKNSEALLKHRDDGVVVLDTIPGLPGELMGLRSGDLIVSVNNTKVNSVEDIEAILSQYTTFIWIDVKDVKGEERVIEHKNYVNGVEKLGIIHVPKHDYGISMVEERDGFLIGKIKKIFNK